MSRLADMLAPRLGHIVVIGLGLAALGMVVPMSWAGLALVGAGLGLTLLAALLFHLGRRHRRQQADLHRTISSFVERDASPSFTTDDEGVIGYRNAAARDRFAAGGTSLLVALGDTFAAPAATLHRLQTRAAVKGFAREDVVMRRGHMRLSCIQIGKGGFLWRLEDIADRAQNGRNADGISLPMMTVSKSGTVLFMNDALRRLLGGREGSLDRIFNDLPLRDGHLHEIAGIDGPVRSRACVIEGSAGRREVYLLPQGATEEAEATIGNALFEHLPVALLKVAPDGKIGTANQLARQLLAVEDIAGRYVGELVEGLGRSMADWLREVAEKKGHPRAEFVRASAQTQEQYLKVTVTQVVENGLPQLIVVLNDDTKLKSLEAQFVQSQKMQAIGQLAGGVAHDFNNLLTAISGHCDLLMLRHDQGDPDFGDLVQISQNANRAAGLVAHLLAFSRKQTLKPEIIEVRETLEDLTHLLNRLVGEKVKLRLDLDHEIAPIRADKRQLEQVIMNLVVNARDAMPKGGEIRIESRQESFAQPFERDRASVPAGEYVVIAVVDQGNGIAPDKLPKIFEPFYTTKRTGEGTGLGLSMAYGIVKQTGGFIFADSVVGSGTAFTLFFPAHVRGAEEVSAAQGAQAGGTPHSAHAAIAAGPADRQPRHDGAPAALPVFAHRGAEQGDDAALVPTATRITAERIGALMAAEGAADGADGAADRSAADMAPTTDIPAATDPAAADPAAGLTAIETRVNGHVPDLPAAGPAPRDGAPPNDRAAPLVLPKPTHVPQRAVVLLVEDEAPVRAFASRALKMRGFTVLEAENAEQALATLEDESLDIDVFVTDVIMPGMDGPSWVARALEQRKGVKVVFMSGYAEDSFAEQQARIPNSVFLPKPFSLSELTATVQQQLQ